LRRGRCETKRDTGSEVLVSTGDIGLEDVTPDGEDDNPRGATVLRGRLLWMGNVEEVGDLMGPIDGVDAPS
jgi:hypothetical protein